MSDETTPQEPVKGPEEPKSKEPSIKELMAQMEAVRQAQSGSDKKVKELSDALTQSKLENEELKKERMNEKEKAQFELEKSRKELEAQKAEVAAQRIALERTSVLSDLGLPQSFAPFVHGNTKDELTERAGKLKAVFTDEVVKAANVNLVAKKDVPKSGDPIMPTGEFNSFAAGQSDEFQLELERRIKAG